MNRISTCSVMCMLWPQAYAPAYHVWVKSLPPYFIRPDSSFTSCRRLLYLFIHNCITAAVINPALLLHSAFSSCWLEGIASRTRETKSGCSDSFQVKAPRSNAGGYKPALPQSISQICPDGWRMRFLGKMSWWTRQRVLNLLGGESCGHLPQALLIVSAKLNQSSKAFRVLKGPAP